MGRKETVLLQKIFDFRCNMQAVSFGKAFEVQILKFIILHALTCKVQKNMADRSLSQVFQDLALKTKS